jgi:hypothetical protein
MFLVFWVVKYSKKYESINFSDIITLVINCFFKTTFCILLKNKMLILKLSKHYIYFIVFLHLDPAANG